MTAALFKFLAMGRERLPPLPTSLDEVNFDEEWSKTFNGEDFLQASRNDVLMHVYNGEQLTGSIRS